MSLLQSQDTAQPRELLVDQNTQEVPVGAWTLHEVGMLADEKAV